eukprot:GFUD01026143.1.p2 GENE.GFUD01026143.1~~GFUD01026143.1.p2  ORF type:complete len:107 (+),score=40.24 GFUD01026143.1:148-468(+)
MIPQSAGSLNPPAQGKGQGVPRDESAHISEESIKQAWEEWLPETDEDRQRCTWTVDDLSTGDETWKTKDRVFQNNNNKNKKKRSANTSLPDQPDQPEQPEQPYQPD